MRLFIFGSFNNTGHEVLDVNRRRVNHDIVSYDVGRACDMLPTPLPGVRDRPEVEGALIRMPASIAGWSYITWWDRQGDERRGSHTGLLAQGEWTNGQLIAEARAQAPWAFRIELLA